MEILLYCEEFLERKLGVVGINRILTQVFSNLLVGYATDLYINHIQYMKLVASSDGLRYPKCVPLDCTTQSLKYKQTFLQLFTIPSMSSIMSYVKKRSN